MEQAGPPQVSHRQALVLAALVLLAGLTAWLVARESPAARCRRVAFEEAQSQRQEGFPPSPADVRWAAEHCGKGASR